MKAMLSWRYSLLLLGVAGAAMSTTVAQSTVSTASAIVTSTPAVNPSSSPTPTVLATSTVNPSSSPTPTVLATSAVNPSSSPTPTVLATSTVNPSPSSTPTIQTTTTVNPSPSSNPTIQTTTTVNPSPSSTHTVQATTLVNLSPSPTPTVYVTQTATPSHSSIPTIHSTQVVTLPSSAAPPTTTPTPVTCVNGTCTGFNDTCVASINTTCTTTGSEKCFFHVFNKTVKNTYTVGCTTSGECAAADTLCCTTDKCNNKTIPTTTPSPSPTTTHGSASTIQAWSACLIAITAMITPKPLTCVDGTCSGFNTTCYASLNATCIATGSGKCFLNVLTPANETVKNTYTVGCTSSASGDCTGPASTIQAWSACFMAITAMIVRSF